MGQLLIVNPVECVNLRTLFILDPNVLYYTNQVEIYFLIGSLGVVVIFEEMC